jgi:D-amino-acid oxidase
MRHQFEYIPDAELPPGTASGARFTTLTIDTPAYLAWLSTRLLARGGRLVRGTVQHVAQVAEGSARAFAQAHAGTHRPVRHTSVWC